MKYRVNLVSDAEDDLFEIYRYVYLNDSSEQADKLLSKLYAKCLSLGQQAERGHKVPELEFIGVDQFLQINYKPYRIIYNIIGKEVFIHCVLDGRREMQKILQDKILRTDL